MKMNIKQQYLLRLLGLEKKGALTDFEAFALKGNLDFRKASAVADMLVWYSKEAGIPKLAKVTRKRVMDAAEDVKTAFDMLEMLECGCVSPFDKVYPNGFFSLLDIKHHVIHPPYLFCKGNVDLLLKIRLSMVVSQAFSENDESLTEGIIQGLKDIGALPLIPVTNFMCRKLVRHCMNCGIIPVLLLPGGLDGFLLDADNPYADILCDVMEADGLLVTVNPPGVKQSKPVVIKTLLHVAGFSPNVITYYTLSEGQSDTMFESAIANKMQVFVPDNLVSSGTCLSQNPVSKRKDVVYLKQGFKICGLLR